jgi:hypothetical protein
MQLMLFHGLTYVSLFTCCCMFYNVGSELQGMHIADWSSAVE